jgi:hypothetical protein
MKDTYSVGYRSYIAISLICAILLQLFGLEESISQESKSAELRVAMFDVDATPPVGSYMAYQPVVNTWDMGLRARGIVLLGAGQPIVLLSVDWIGISNEGQDEFKRVLAGAAGTIPERVAVHTIHQHDAPRCDFSTERILRAARLNPAGFDGTFSREVIQRLEVAVRKSLTGSQPVTHIGLGEAQVYQVASNRRIVMPGGKVGKMRGSASRDSTLIAEPEGIIDPMVSLISFWNGDRPLAILSYYATHPQSYYMTSIPNPDFPGIARFYRQLAVPDALHVHFNGASGNVAAGKYNDGAKEKRGILAERLADGMKRAWEATKREPVTPDAIGWKFEPVVLPLNENIEKLKGEINVKMKDTAFLMVKPWNRNARRLVLLQRYEAGEKIDVSCLTIGRARILHLPGELFIEYQLAAKKMRPDLFVTMAAYGDCAHGYIGTAISYNQGGYEIGASNVSASAEAVLMSAIRKLLEAR